MKKLFAILSSVLVLAGVSLAADTVVTNLGQVITVRTYGDMVTATKDVTVYQDASDYANKVGESGNISRFYDFDTHGGATGVIKLYPPIKIPKGALIRNGVVRVVDIPDAYTNSLSISGTADILAAATNLSIGASKNLAVVPVGTAATSVYVTNDAAYVTLTTTAPLTKGKFMVILDYVLAP